MAWSVALRMSEVSSIGEYVVGMSDVLYVKNNL